MTTEFKRMMLLSLMWVLWVLSGIGIVKILGYDNVWWRIAISILLGMAMVACTVAAIIIAIRIVKSFYNEVIKGWIK